MVELRPNCECSDGDLPPATRGTHTGFRVRPIEAADSNDVVAVWRSTWTATYETALGAAALGKMLRDLDENGTVGMISARAQGLCLVHEGRIVGTAIHSKDGPIVYLWGMYVLPQHQRLVRAA